MVILGLWLLVAISFVIKYQLSKNDRTFAEQKETTPTNELQSNKSYKIKIIVVLAGNKFDLTIGEENPSRLLLKIAVQTVDDAKKKIVSLLNSSTNPEVVLDKKTETGEWIGEIHFVQDGKKNSISNWMIENNLVYR